MVISEAYVAFDMHLLHDDFAEKTRKSYYTVILGVNGLVNAVGDIPVELLGLDHINAWRLHMRSLGLKPHYINHNLSQIRQFLKWLGENEHRVFDWRKITFDKEEKNKPHTILTREEINSLVSHAKNPRDKAILKMVFDGFGGRIEEILSLDRGDWEDATQVEDGLWEIWVMGKNKKYRPVCFFQDLKDTVDAYLETRTDRFKPLFTSIQNRRIHYTTVNQMIHEVSRRAGMTKRVTPHVGRHTYATERAAGGTPTPVLSYQLGHAHEGVTQKVYTHINAFHSRRAHLAYLRGKQSG